MRGKGLALAALALVPFLMVLGNSMLIPVLPEMKDALNISKTTSSLVVTAFSVAAGIAIVAAGYLADRYGRKKVLIPAVLLYGAGGLISGLAAVILGERAFGVIMVGRLVQGIGAAGTGPVSMAMAADLFKRNRTQAMGVIEAANGMGKVISPVAGAAIGLIAWWMPFFVYASVSIPIAFAIAGWTKEPEGSAAAIAQQPNLYVRQVIGVFKEKGGSLAACFFAGTTMLMILFGILFYLSDFLEKQLGLDGVPKGLVLAIPVLLLCGMAFFAGRYLQTHMNLLKNSVLMGIALEIVGTALVAILPRSTLALGLGVAVGSLGAGLVLPAINSMVTGCVDVELRGMITALYGSIRFLGVAAGPPLFGWLIEIGRALPFWVSVGLLLIGLGLAYWQLNPKQMLGEEPFMYPLKGQVLPPSGEAWELPKGLPAGTRRTVLGPQKPEE